LKVFVLNSIFSNRRSKRVLFRFVLFNLLLVLPNISAAATESRSWLGPGRAFGSYIEKNRGIDEDLSGKSNEIVFYHRKGDWGISTGVGLLESEISENFYDNSGNFHDIYYSNVSGYLLLGLKIKILFVNLAGHGILGVSDTTFRKTFRDQNGVTTNYEKLKDRTYLTGSEGLVFFDLQDNWVLGTKTGIYNRSLSLKFGDDTAEFVQDKNVIVFLGLKWGGSSSGGKKKGKKK